MTSFDTLAILQPTLSIPGNKAKEQIIVGGSRSLFSEKKMQNVKVEINMKLD